MKGFGEQYNSTEKISIDSKFSTQQIINQAFKLHSEGRISEATKFYQYLINQGLQDHRLFYNFGVLVNGLGKLPEAESLYRKAIKLKPDFAEAYYNLGTILKNLGRLKEAESSYRKAIDIKPDFAMAHLNLGSTLKDLRKLQEAESYFIKAIKFNPNFAEAHSNLGTILKDLGNLNEAEISTRKAIEINPDFADAHANLGSILRDQGKSQEAELSARRAIELNPGQANAHCNLGSILRDLGKLLEAESHFRKAIELNPDHANAHCNLGIMFFLNNVGKLPEAESHFRKAIKLQPNKLSYFYYANYFFKIKSYEEAEKYLDKAKSFKEKGVENWFLAAAESSIKHSKKKSTNQSELDFTESSKKFDKIILNRKVESELKSHLYSLKNIQLDNTKDSRYGGGICSSDFSLFEDNSKIITTLANDIREICKKELMIQEMIICDSFFNIFVTGCGQPKHNHVKLQDKLFDIHQNKYSLVYYLEIGDQQGEDPGILKLHEPEEEILPTNGMIVIIDAKKNHSVSYRGNKDRIMIGVNFYGF